MKIYRLILSLLLFVFVIEAASAVEIGAQLKDVLGEKGQPSSTIEAGHKQILTFVDRSIVTFEDDRVVAVSAETPRLKSFPESPRTTLSTISRSRSLLLNSAVVSAVASLVLFRIFFSDLQDFFGCVRYYLQPNWVSLFRGEAAEDYWSTAKLFVWFAISLGVGIIFYGYRGGNLDSAIAGINELFHGG